MGKDDTKILAIITGAFVLIGFGIGMLPTVNDWEKGHHYPYGRMCHSILTLYQDTCKR